MFRFSPRSNRFSIATSVSTVLACTFGAGFLQAAPKLDFRASTKDKITATIYNSQTRAYGAGKAQQGSFGAPSLNDKGSVAYACILSGAGLATTDNQTIVVRLAGSKPARVALQSGFIVSDTFLPGVLQGNSFPKSQSGYFYRLGVNVGINNKNNVAYTGQLLYTLVTPGTPPSFADMDTAVYGLAVPTTKKATAFTNNSETNYLNYFDDILKENVSLNSQNAIVYSGNFYITSSKSVPGFAFAAPSNGGIIATTDSAVIGLPYFTTFSQFSSPIISDKNVAFVVANLSDATLGFDGIWQGSNPDLQPVAVKNTKAAGGGTYATFNGVVGASRNGKLCAFIASVAGGPATSGVFRVKVDGTGDIKVASAGANAPTYEGVGALGTFTTFTLAAAGNNGNVAFLADVTTPSGAVRSGIWVSDKNGDNIALIAVEGQTLVNGKVSKKITKLTFNPVSGINSKGQVAFTASFSDRTSSVILATP